MLACAALVGNSSTTVIGAMLVASLTGPVMGIGLALVNADHLLLRRAAAALLGGVLLVLVLATSALIGRLMPDAPPTEEMLMLTAPSLIHLVVALVGGAISAYARFTSAEVAAMGRSLPPAPDGSAPQLRLRHVQVDVEAMGD